jgi:hypothetical protein
MANSAFVPADTAALVEDRFHPTAFVWRLQAAMAFLLVRAGQQVLTPR